jgi:hypothetical protein
VLFNEGLDALAFGLREGSFDVVEDRHDSGVLEVVFMVDKVRWA